MKIQRFRQFVFIKIAEVQNQACLSLFSFLKESEEINYCNLGGKRTSLKSTPAKCKIPNVNVIIQGYILRK